MTRVLIAELGLSLELIWRSRLQPVSRTRVAQVHGLLLGVLHGFLGLVRGHCFDFLGHHLMILHLLLLPGLELGHQRPCPSWFLGRIDLLR